MIYVEAARDDFTPQGKGPSHSRVAILTGLTRKNAKRLRESEDMPPKTMLEELQRVHAVKQTDDGKTHVLSRAYLPDYDDPSGIHEPGAALHDLTDTIEHNLNPQRSGPVYFQRMVSNERVRAQSLPLFKRIVAQHGQRWMTS